MSKAGAQAGIYEALSRVGWNEDAKLKAALYLALEELNEIQIIEVGIERRGRKYDL